MKRQSYYAGRILGIQAKEETNNTQPTNKKPAIKGGKQNEGGGQSTTHTTPQTTQKKRGEEPGGSRGQRENVTHTHQEGYERALAESKKGPRIIR